MLKNSLVKLVNVTAGCRDNMHEPDEQGLEVVVTGYHLDNAMGDDPIVNCGEFTVGFTHDHGNSYTWINLADLIALARKAVV